MRMFPAILLALALSLPAFALGADKPLTVQVDNKPVLSLQLPADWSAQTDKGQTNLKAPAYETHINLWQVATAKSVEEALPQLQELIKGEVLEFKVTETNPLAAANIKGKHLVGTGTEADDGDPSNAEVFLFSAGGKVYLLLTHGEGKGARNARTSVLAVLASAKPLP